MVLLALLRRNETSHSVGCLTKKWTQISLSSQVSVSTQVSLSTHISARTCTCNVRRESIIQCHGLLCRRETTHSILLYRRDMTRSSGGETCLVHQVPDDKRVRRLVSCSWTSHTFSHLLPRQTRTRTGVELVVGSKRARKASYSTLLVVHT